MNPNRRKFFGIVGGAALAPSLAQAGESVGDPIGGRWVGKDMTRECNQVPQADPLYFAKERARLQAIASGKLDDWHIEEIEDQRLHASQDAAICNIDALRSVSAPVKRHMLAEHYARQLRGNFMREAERSLRSMLKGAWG